MQEMINSKHLLIYSRNFFKGSLKAGNKTFSTSYGDACQERKKKRNENAIRANTRILFLREHSNEKILEMLYRLIREDRVGNCQEYAFIAIDYGVRISMPDVWLVVHDSHVFVLLADTEIFYQQPMPLSDFSKYKNDRYWICDPWFNIHCKMCEYEPMVSLKAAKWEQEGKRIGTYESTSIAAKEWSLKLSSGEIQFFKMTTHNGTRTRIGGVLYSR
ncbi:hypothetical protein [Endozoicomonas lisbonensis]|uniref:Protein glutaminase domain-containing protein n=1 Tax=Endozoicomonas lisbonensis TaxID=3120522 RepID=A0ABV2SJ59_9GAMM